ncbi:MAG: hypothetical protein Ct9H90mP30_6860 [Actinomycetota bacterium]|nr:MAG: hypothetical protein Ct9H90mP30_6860 [Actinomycetota bacterium]
MRMGKCSRQNKRIFCRISKRALLGYVSSQHITEGKHNVAKHTKIVGEHKDENLEAVQAASVYTPGTEAIAIIGRALVLIVGGRMVLNGELEIGELTAFLFTWEFFFTPIQTLTQLYNGYQQGQAAVAKLRDLLATIPSVPEDPSAQPIPDIQGEIVFGECQFLLSMTKKPVLKKNQSNY